MGRPACAIVPQVMNTGRAALSLGCCERAPILTSLPTTWPFSPSRSQARSIRRGSSPGQGQRSLQVPSTSRRDVAAGGTPPSKTPWPPWRPNDPRERNHAELGIVEEQASDGCPMFAKAFMDEKDVAKPLPMYFRASEERCRSSDIPAAHRAKAFTKIVSADERWSEHGAPVYRCLETKSVRFRHKPAILIKRFYRCMKETEKSPGSTKILPILIARRNPSPSLPHF